MTLNFAVILLALFGLSFILIALSLWLLQYTSAARQGYSTPARFFLIALRLAIGWHCLIEGMEKYSLPSWSSEPYLRESMGPLAGFFQWIAGDRLVEKLTVGDPATFPTQLDREWRGYLQAFAAYYELDSEQNQRAEGILAQREEDTLTSLVAKKQEVTRISDFPPALKLNLSMKERLEELQRLQDLVRVAEARFPSTDPDALNRWKTAKANLGKWRSELKKSLDDETLKLKQALDDVLTSEQKQRGPMPEPHRLPLKSWRLLEWSDALVEWGLIVLGSCLLLGLFARLSSLATALLILSFYAAMPPLPGWPESPRLEGHYLLINKTLIEAIALLALACIPTGRWAGLDGLLQALFPGRSRPVAPAAAPAGALPAHAAAPSHASPVPAAATSSGPGPPV